MSDTSTCEQALRLARRQADLAVARSLAALCYGKKTEGAEAAELSQLVSAAVEQRREVEVRLGKHREFDAVASPTEAGGPAGSMEQMVRAAGQTRALRLPKETPSLAELRQRVPTG